MCSALYRGGEPYNYCCHNQEGGKSSQNAGRFGSVGAVCRGVSLQIHWRLSQFQSHPLPLQLRPLSTTFVHILRLTCLLSIRNLQVVMGLHETLGKLPEIVAY